MTFADFERSNPREEFAEAFNEVQRVQNIISRAGPGIRNFIPKRHFRKCLATMNAFVMEYVNRALLLSPDELASKTKSDMSYTFLHELASYTRDPKVLRDQLVAVLLAGRDTTASSLSWTIYELGRHPEVVARLRAEILSTVGPHRTPTYADLKGMKYLQNVMNETLRLYPVVPFNVRSALKDTLLPRGGGPDGTEPLAVLKDTPIGYSTLLMQRREDLYPPVSKDFKPAGEFSPERWYHWQPRPWQYSESPPPPFFPQGVSQFSALETINADLCVKIKFPSMAVQGSASGSSSRSRRWAMC